MNHRIYRLAILAAVLLCHITSVALAEPSSTGWMRQTGGSDLQVATAGTTPAQAQASKLKPATISFLQELGINPWSRDIFAIAADSVTAKSGKVYTLDSLAAKRDETGVKSFIATRVFIHAFRKDSSVEFPNDELYNILYLTADEKAYISKKLLEAFPKPK